MAGDVEITVGSRSVREAIEKIKRYQRHKLKDVEQAVNDTALDVHADAVRRSPVVTNRYRSSLHIQTGSPQRHTYTDNEGHSFDGMINVTVPKMGAIVGTNVEYALSVERRHFVLSRAAQINRPKFRKRIIDILNKK